MIFQLARELRRKGVMAINRRNAEYILPYNPRRLYPLVDDKVRTKEIAQKSGIAVPELYGVIEVEGQVRNLPEIVKDHPDFVIKPAHGSGGEGILVVDGKIGDRYRKHDGLIIDVEETNHYIFNLLSGLHSLGGQPDRALVEYRVRHDPIFEPVSYRGVPDIRIIVFLGVPVMSMVRLPTRMSDGKANLHQGAIGAGVDMATGVTLRGVWKNDSVTEHPDTGNSVKGIAIPGWPGLLELAARCYELTGLGYMGVDIVLDREKGPLILEMNARPGLSIQIANDAGILPRLGLVKENIKDLGTAAARVAFAKQNFRSDPRC